MAENSTTEEKKTTTASTTSTTSSTSSSSPTKVNTKEIQKRNMQMFINKLSKFELHQADAMIVAIRIAKESKTADKLTREERKALNTYFCAGFVNNWPQNHDAALNALMKHRKAKIHPLIDEFVDFCSGKKSYDITEVLMDIAYDRELADRTLPYLPKSSEIGTK